MTDNLPANIQENEHGFLTQTKPAQPQSLIHAESEKAVAEIKAAYMMAAMKPRDQLEAHRRILNACKRKGLAEKAMYAFPKGKQLVTGPSIRLLEVIAQNWGNIRMGVQELSSNGTETTMRAYCTDLETNFADEKTFSIEHVVDTKFGRKELESQRDIYENNANFAARRKRACMIGVIPPDVIADAVSQCEKTLAGDASEPIEDRAKKMVMAFSELGVTKDMIEKRLGHNLSAIVAQEIVALQQIYSSIKDGMGKREEFFEVAPKESDLNEKFGSKPAKEETK